MWEPSKTFATDYRHQEERFPPAVVAVKLSAPEAASGHWKTGGNRQEKHEQLKNRPECSGADALQAKLPQARMLGDIEREKQVRAGHLSQCGHRQWNVAQG